MSGYWVPLLHRTWNEASLLSCSLCGPAEVQSQFLPQVWATPCPRAVAADCQRRVALGPAGLSICWLRRVTDSPVRRLLGWWLRTASAGCDPCRESPALGVDTSKRRAVQRAERAGAGGQAPSPRAEAQEAAGHVQDCGALAAAGFQVIARPSACLLWTGPCFEPFCLWNLALPAPPTLAAHLLQFLLLPWGGEQRLWLWLRAPGTGPSPLHTWVHLRQPLTLVGVFSPSVGKERAFGCQGCKS